MDEYCAWILLDDSWGGEIEISILSFHFKVEIVALDIQSCNKYCYGQGEGYAKQIFIMYDGIHYDAIAQIAMENAPMEKDVTQFDAKDASKLDSAMVLVREAHQLEQFTNVQKFTLRCMDCRMALQGQQQGTPCSSSYEFL